MCQTWNKKNQKELKSMLSLKWSFWSMNKDFLSQLRQCSLVSMFAIIMSLFWSVWPKLRENIVIIFPLPHVCGPIHFMSSIDVFKGKPFGEGCSCTEYKPSQTIFMNEKNLSDDQCDDFDKGQSIAIVKKLYCFC
jgi:hypothetical protein